MESNNIEKLHEEHLEWMEEITAWHNELVYYNRVLLRLVEGAKEGEDTEKMEEFKSRFDNLEDLFVKTKRSIEIHEAHLNDAAAESHTDKHRSMRVEMKSFKKQFLDLKNDFYVFEEKFIYE